MISEILFSQWHPTLNVLDPTILAEGSNKKAWWKCEDNHIWEAAIAQRNKGGGCPYCSGRKPIIGINDLLTTHPHDAMFWDFSKNDDISLTEVSAGSGKKAWWIGECGHGWRKIIREQVESSYDCPFCSGKQLLNGVNLLNITVTHPNLARLWNYEKNTEPIETVTYGPSNKYWWKCQFGHEWQNTPIGQNKKQGCSECQGKVFRPGVNDLLSTHPELASEWHPDLNTVTPEEVFNRSLNKAWWLCPAGHSWETVVLSRVKGVSCPYCAGQKIKPGENDLETLYPEIAKEWHPTKNGIITPNQVAPKTGKRFWWQCSQGHEWDTTVLNRVNSTTKCPICAGRIVLPGFNDLSSIYPHIAAELHPTKNGAIKGTDVTIASGKKMWWQCSKGHEWETFVYQRTKKDERGNLVGTGCPHCWASANSSQPEQLIFEHLISNGVKVVRRSKSIIPNRKELDLYLPDHKIAIEYNGLYWHSHEKLNDKNYHYSKWLECKKLGIQLIQIWEDDFLKNPNLILKMIDYKVGVASNSTKIFARKTTAVEITNAEARLFMEENHIQGFASGSYYLGLKNHNSNTVAVLILKQESNETLNIIRYATANQVVGGFTKLLSEATKNYHPKNYVTFADHCVSDGKLYESTGFKAIAEIKPDYKYVGKSNVREHKFNFRLAKFKSNPNLKYEPGLTETQLADLNKLLKIWDAGKTKYAKQVIS